jgi:hypothetical protein
MASTLHDTALGAATGSGTTVSTTDALAITSGDLVVVCVKWEDVSTTCTAKWDGTNSATQSNAVLGASSSSFGSMFYAVANSSGNYNPSATLGSAASFKYIRAYSFTPTAGKTWTLGNITAGTGSGMTLNPGSLSTNAAGGVSVFTYALYASATSFTPLSPLVEAAEFAVSESIRSEYGLPTGATTYSDTRTVNTGGSYPWVGQGAEWYEVDGAASTQAPRSMQQFRLRR